jgi:hypothetical protein
MNVANFWDIALYTLTFQRMYDLYLLGRKSVEQETSLQQMTRQAKPSAGISLGKRQEIVSILIHSLPCIASSTIQTKRK